MDYDKLVDIIRVARERDELAAEVAELRAELDAANQTCATYQDSLHECAKERAELREAIQFAAEYVDCPNVPCACGRADWFDRPAVKRALEES